MEEEIKIVTDYLEPVSYTHLKGFPWSKERGREIWDSFRRLIRQVGEEKAGLFLIAGDLFHRQPLMKELKEVNYLFSTIPDTKVVLIAGNHDYLKRESCYRRFSWAENVFCLWGEQEPCVEFPDLGAAVYGISYDRKETVSYTHLFWNPFGTAGQMS